MESRAQVLTEIGFYFLENVPENPSSPTIVWSSPILQAIEVMTTGNDKLIPITCKIGQFILLSCFIRWENCREYILEQIYQIISEEAPSTIPSNSMQLINYNIDKTPISTKARLYCQIIEKICTDFVGILSEFQHLIYEWFVELPCIRMQIAKKIQYSCLFVVRAQQTLIDQLVVLFQKQMQSTHGMERELALRALCVIFSFHTNPDKEREFLYILKNALALQLSYRKTTYNCIMDFIISENEYSFPQSTKLKILDILSQSLESYLICINGIQTFSVGKCVRLLPNKNIDEITPKELFGDLIFCISCLANQCSVDIPQLQKITDVLLDGPLLHNFLFTNRIYEVEDFVDEEDVPPQLRMELLIELYVGLIEHFASSSNIQILGDLIDYYTIVLYIRYHSIPQCKWNSHWKLYTIIPSNFPQFKNSLNTSIKVLEYYASQIENINLHVPLLNIYIQLDSLERNLNEKTLIKDENLKAIFIVLSRIINTLRDSTKNMRRVSNFREHLVNFDKLLKVIPNSGGVFEKLISHCASQDTTMDLESSISCQLLSIFNTLLSKIPIQSRKIVEVLLSKSFKLSQNVSGALTWLSWTIHLMNWLQDDFETGITPEILSSYINLITSCYDPLSLRYEEEKSLELIESITNQWMIILQTYTITQHKVIKGIIDYLFKINPPHSAIPIARSLLLSILNEPLEDDMSDDEERLLITETKACRSNSLRTVLEFYKKILQKIKQDLQNNLSNWSKEQTFLDLIWIINSDHKKLIGDLLTLLHFIMVEKMDFMETHKQIPLFLQISSILLSSLQYCCTAPIKLKYIQLVKKEISMELDTNLFSVLKLTKENPEPTEFPCEHIILLFHSLITFCNVFTDWLSQYRQYLPAGKLPELSGKKQKVIDAINHFIEFGKKKEILCEKTYQFLNSAIQFTSTKEKNSSLFTLPTTLLSPKIRRKKKKHHLPSKNKFINEALAETTGNDDFSDLEDFIASDEEIPSNSGEEIEEENSTIKENNIVILQPRKKVRIE